MWLHIDLFCALYECDTSITTNKSIVPLCLRPFFSLSKQEITKKRRSTQTSTCLHLWVYGNDRSCEYLSWLEFWDQAIDGWQDDINSFVFFSTLSHYVTFLSGLCHISKRTQSDGKRLVFFVMMMIMMMMMRGERPPVHNELLYER